MHLLASLVLAATTNNRPIIGILAVPGDHSNCTTLVHALPSGAAPSSCFHSLYVKWLEAAGARVVPLPYDLPKPAFEQRLEALNGALITGGETNVKTLDSPYMQAAGRLYNTSLARHASGESWPLWGTCMGFQVLSILGARDPSVLLSNAYDSEGIVLPLELTADAKPSMLLCDDCLHPAEALATLTNKNSTVNLHHDGVDPKAFAAGGRLGGAFKVLSTNVDSKGKAFASTIEARGGAPVWGTQWHPERYYEWRTDPSHNFDHNENNMLAMWAVAARLVRAARLNQRAFADARAEAKALIYNYQPVGDDSYQAYFF